MANALVVGVGMSRFVKPGSGESYEVMAEQAIRAALSDSDLDYTRVNQAYASYVCGDSCSGQRALYGVGMTGIPVINVNNNCSSGSTALFMARQAVESGAVDCALAFGFEMMKPGALGEVWQDRTRPLGWLEEELDLLGVPPGPVALRIFGAAANEYIDRYQASPELFYEIAVKNRRHALANPNALFDQPISQDEVKGSGLIFPNYLTRLCACPPSCGAAAAIVCSPGFARRMGLSGGVAIRGQAMCTDTEQTKGDCLELAGAGLTRSAAAQAYEASGLGPSDINIIELHDCFAPNEAISLEALGICEEGRTQELIRDGAITHGGKCVVNPSGGLLSKGHPLGATGLAQCAELVWHLRGVAGDRQVKGARVALQHNIGLGGAAVVTLYAC